MKPKSDSFRLPGPRGRSRSTSRNVQRRCNPKWPQWLAFTIFALSLVAVWRWTKATDDVPPTWKKLRKWERSLPQHYLDLRFPEGRHGRYVLFSNQIIGLGWNNQLNEILMLTWLAHRSNRAYVFKELPWNHAHYPWKLGRFAKRPHTPLNALLSGPTAGGPWDPSDSAPRSVSEDFFNVVCPKHKRRIINTREIKPALAEADGIDVFNTWEKVLKDAPEGCIEVEKAEEDNFPQTFDLWLFGSHRCLSLWEGFKNSPVSRLLGTSPIVNAAVSRNEFLFRPRARPPVPASNDPYERMLALHLRRGDYKEACEGFATWNSTFYNWNLLPSLPDPFENPADWTWGKPTESGKKTYMNRCYPSDERILRKIQSARDDYVRAAPNGEHRHLDVIFLLTNDKTEWVENMKQAFKRNGWTTIVTTRDLQLDQEQKEVGMAVDMDLARKAAVFIGNGWSSFTSNIVHRRLVDGKEPISNRFF